jgi:hypothetical protein
VWISEPSCAALASCSAVLVTNTVTTAGNGLLLRFVVVVTVPVISTSCGDGLSVHPGRRAEDGARLRRGAVRIAVHGEELHVETVVP